MCDSNTSLASHYVRALLKMYPTANFKGLLNSRPIVITHPKAYIYNEKFNHTVESYAIVMENKKKNLIETIAERRNTCKIETLGLLQIFRLSYCPGLLLSEVLTSHHAGPNPSKLDRN